MYRRAVNISILLILVITFLSFYPSLKNGFVNWDDNEYVIENSSIHSLSLKNLKNIFSSFCLGNYHPVTMTSYALEYQFFKLNPFAYHCTNLFIHLLNSLLVFWLILILSGNIFVSFLTAVLFGVHPLHVESVAWISERKDVLYSFFSLSAIISYLYFFKKSAGKYYYLSIILFVLSLLSKSMAVTLPLLLLLMDYLMRRRPTISIFKEKIPYFALSFLFGIIAILGVFQTGAVRNENIINFTDKIMLKSYSIIFYLNKIFVPIKLASLYPFPQTAHATFYLYYAIVLVILLVAIIFSARFTRKIIFGSSFFLVAIFPALQFIPNGEILVADRYTYISSIGIFYLIAEGFYWLYSKKAKYYTLKKWLILIILLIGVSFLAFLTWNRCKIWKDGVSLWTDVLSKYPNVKTAYNNRGMALLENGEYKKAQADFNKSVNAPEGRYKSTSGKRLLYYNLNMSSLYNSEGKYTQAIELLEKAIKEDPQQEYKYYNNLAASYSFLGNQEKAIQLLETAIERNNNVTDKAENCYNLGLIYENLGNYAEAIKFFEESIKFDDCQAQAYYGLGRIYHENNIKKAMAYYEKAIKRDPAKEYFYNDLAVAAFTLNNYRKTISLCKKAIKINPSYADAYVNLGNAYLAISDTKKAALFFNKAISINSNLGVAYNNLALVYYYEKNYDLALKHYKKAIELGYKVSPILFNLLRPYIK